MLIAVILIAPIENCTAINEEYERRGLGPNNLWLRFSSTGEEPATHLASAYPESSNVESSSSLRLTAEEIIAKGQDPSASPNEIAMAEVFANVVIKTGSYATGVIPLLMEESSAMGLQFVQ